jgi:phosphoribosylanthranilate isomerase
MLIKICGITNLEDALLAVAAGAGALGFNFWRPSRRFIEPVAARVIIDQLPANVLTVGVFVNEAAAETVERIAKQAGVAAMQLHGDESPEYCEKLAHHYVIKALAVGSNFDPASALKYNVRAIMLDAFDKNNRGGTGRSIDWSIARRTRELVPRLFLAGGLSPENIAAAIAAVDPYAVDACSALETVAGKKDPEMVRSFIRAALAAESGKK